MSKIKNFSVYGAYYNLMQAINTTTGKWEHFIVQYDSFGGETSREAIQGIVKEISVDRDEYGTPTGFTIKLAE